MKKHLYINRLLTNIFQKLNFIFSVIFQRQFSEKLFLKKILNQSSVVVDVGSNLGNFIALVKKINKNIKTFSIEPVEELIIYQKKRFSSLENIIYSNIAISDKKEKNKLYIRFPISHSSLIKYHDEDSFNKIIETREVQTLSLKDYILDMDVISIKLLKIDTEGLDRKILFSITELLQQKKIDYLKIEGKLNSINKIFNFAYKHKLEFVSICNATYHKNSLVMIDIYFRNNN